MIEVMTMVKFLLLAGEGGGCLLIVICVMRYGMGPEKGGKGEG